MSVRKRTEYGLKSGALLDGRYRIAEIYEVRDMEIVYEALHEQIHKKVFVRELYCESLMCRDGENDLTVTFPTEQKREAFLLIKQRFLKVARAFGDFREEEGLLSVVDSFEENGTAYAVTEWFSGRTLGKYLEETGRIEAGELVQRVWPVMTLLRKIHEGGLSYRRLNPDLVLVCEDGSMKLAGFSWEQVPGDEWECPMPDAYMPWEVLQEEAAVGPWSDIYALCAVMSQCLTGKAPQMSVARVLFDEWKLPSEAEVHIPDRMRKILEKGMKIPCEERYRNMEELMIEMQEMLPKKQEKKRFSRAAVITTAVFCLGIGGAILGWLYYRENPEKFQFYGVDTLTVLLVPDEQMKAKEYYEAVDVIESRVSQLFGEDNYVLKEKKGQIELIAPQSLYAGLDVGEYMDACVASPLQISLGVWFSNEEWMGYELESFFSVSREEILSVEVREAEEPLTDGLEQIIYGEDPVTEILVLELAQEAAEKLESMLLLYQEKMETEHVVPMFALDMEGEGDYQYCRTGAFYEKGSFVGVYLTEELKKYLTCLDQPTFTKEFEVFYEIPVEWEAESVIEGENQCSPEKIQEPSVTLEYVCDDEGGVLESKGSWYRMMVEFKKRLDMLGVPYAFGISPDGSKKVVVKTAQKDMSVMLAEALSSGDISFCDEFGNSLYLSIEEMEFYENEEGKYAFRVAFLPSSVEYYLEQTEEFYQIKGEKIVMKVSDYLVAEGDVETVLQEGEITFTESKIGTSGIFTQDMIPFFELLKSNEENWWGLPVAYRLSEMQYSRSGVLVDVEAAGEMESLQGAKFVPEEEME